MKHNEQVLLQKYKSFKSICILPVINWCILTARVVPPGCQIDCVELLAAMCLDCRITW